MSASPPQSSPGRSYGAVAYDEQRLLARLRDEPQLYEGLRELFWRRREQRREQLEGGDGEKAIVLRGRAQELTTILNEIFPSPRRAPDRFNPVQGDF